jgi:Zn finger protein HypA/HybF involved in hydrogenase expression
MEIIIKKEWVEVDCQNCGKNKVEIWTHTPYFGIICNECNSRDKAFSVRYEY